MRLETELEIAKSRICEEISKLEYSSLLAVTQKRAGLKLALEIIESECSSNVQADLPCT